MRRHLLGLIAGAFLATYVGLLLFGSGDGSTRTFASICMRAGFVLGAIWLALPQLTALITRFPPWLIGCASLALVVLIVRPRLFIYIAPLIGVMAVIQFIGWLFKPLPSSKHQRKASGKPRTPPSD